MRQTFEAVPREWLVCSVIPSKIKIVTMHSINYVKKLRDER